MRQPCKEELQRIANWDVLHDIAGLVAFVCEIWDPPEGAYFNENTELELHTYGWSGNEEIIHALHQNLMFWSFYWAESRRGGHYKFDFSNVKNFTTPSKNEKAG